MKKASILLSFLLLAFLSGREAYAQGSGNTVQFTGIVIGGEESTPIPGVYVFIPKASRGITTNEFGYFSIAVVPGDSVLFSFIGYKKKYHIIPEKTIGTYSVIVDLKEDVTQLSPVTIYPYPTEELFKEAFVKLELPDEQDQRNMRKNLDKRELTQMMLQSRMSPNENFRYFNNSQLYYNTNRNFSPTWTFLNPFNWAKFIKSVKNGDLKRKDDGSKD